MCSECMEGSQLQDDTKLCVSGGPPIGAIIGKVYHNTHCTVTGLKKVLSYIWDRML